MHLHSFTEHKHNFEFSLNFYKNFENDIVYSFSYLKLYLQAALGPIALDLARQLNAKDSIVLANNVLVLSVLAIILTAPLGAILMTKLAPRWLVKGIPVIEGAEPNH